MANKQDAEGEESYELSWKVEQGREQSGSG
jgi:hypothetical protein